MLRKEIEKANLLYIIEEKVFSDYKILTKSKFLLLYSSVISSEWYVKNYNTPIELSFCKPKDPEESYALRGHIWIHPQHRREPELLHEIAHAVTPGCERLGHTKNFCRRYLEFVRYYLGEEIFLYFRYELQKNKLI